MKHPFVVSIAAPAAAIAMFALTAAPVFGQAGQAAQAPKAAPRRAKSGARGQSCKCGQELDGAKDTVGRSGFTRNVDER
jgi:hypothetical protein